MKSPIHLKRKRATHCDQLSWVRMGEIYVAAPEKGSSNVRVLSAQIKKPEIIFIIKEKILEGTCNCGLLNVFIDWR